MATSCALVYRAGIGLLYKKADLPAAQIRRDVAYAGAASTPHQRLDLFLPHVGGLPFVVFVHGGSWDAGSKDLEVGGADVYGNIGRFLASRGVGAAIISYRLLPQVTWQQQVADVAAAVHWVGVNAPAQGGSSACVFLMGHSAGAQLAARVALDPSLRGARGERLPPVCGVIGVSGAGYDLGDRRTYDLGNDPGFYERRFGGAPGWQHAASPIRFVTPDAAGRIPPFLLLYAGGETRALQRQTSLLYNRLLQAGVPSWLVVVPGESHSRIVLTLSRDDKTAGPAILDFIRAHAKRKAPR
jgi:arylformamidase